MRPQKPIITNNKLILFTNKNKSIKEKSIAQMPYTVLNQTNFQLLNIN